MPKTRSRKKSLELHYNPKNNILKRQYYPKCKITPTEYKLLICLASGDAITFEEMKNFLNVTQENLRGIKKRLVDKSKASIEPVQSMGYILKDRLYIENIKENEIDFIKSYMEDEHDDVEDEEEI